MAEKFLAQLPKVAKEDLLDENTCMICHEEYGTPPSDSEPAEEAVRLPCPGGHIVGFNCISSWFQSDMNRKSCPYCRHEFFALTTLSDRAERLFTEHGERLERWIEQWHICRSQLESEGGTPEVVTQWTRWFSRWALAAINVNEESIVRARTARESLFARIGWSEMPADTEAVLWSETGSETALEPLASAIQTRDYREYYWYHIDKRVNDFNPDLLSGPTSRLMSVEVVCYFEHLCRIGAFGEVLQEVRSRREKWKILRSQGFVFDETRWMWSAYPY